MNKRKQKNSYLIKRKQRNSSAPPTVDKNNPELQQLRTYLDSKRAERLSKQQRESLPPSPEHQTIYVCFYFSSSNLILLFVFVSIQRSTNEWNRFDQVEKSYDKAQKRLAPTLIA